MRRVIRLGDPTSHGGRVVSASGTYIIFGKPVARMGDKVSCPIPGHGVVTIAEGDRDWNDNGKPVALEGHHCTCGCVLISTLPNVVRSHEGAGESAAGVMAATVISSPKEDAAVGDEEFDLFFHVKHATTGNSLTNVPYRITLEDGRVFTGVTDDNDYTEIVSSDYSQDAKLEAPYYGDGSNTSDDCSTDSDNRSDACCR